ncbi:CobW family GTP-binding protein [Streptomyces sp. BI20]|uniref:CobW family GTP-binding protein n=1 Tax=Streptomyces sp. BI20 TaxID=3403460 RepID=UPI003C70A55D
MARRPVPVVVLAGFLGSGKTTLLNHLLRGSRGTRIGVLVNDFGAIEVDAMAVAGQVGDSSMVSLGGGCLCCAVDGADLDACLDRLAAPEHGIDVIVIEASGLAEPQELVRMLLANENPVLTYGGAVEVVDAAEFDATRALHPEIDRHLAVADLVVLNKTDRAAPADLDRLRELIGRLAPGTPLVPADHGRIDPELLFDRRPWTETKGQLSFEDLLAEAAEHEDHAHGDHAGTHAHPHSGYESLSWTSGAALDPRALIAFLDSRPPGLYRIKGWVWFGLPGHGEKYEVHAVGRFLSFVPRPWEPGEERGSGLVLIGRDVDTAGLARALDACPAPDPAAVPPEAIWGVLRYVPEPLRPRTEAWEAPREDPEDLVDPYPEDPFGCRHPGDPEED